MPRMNLLFGLALGLCLPLAAQALDKSATGVKKRVAVMDFENRTGHGGALGSGMADMVTTALVKSGRFMVLERQQLAKLLGEQALGMSGAISGPSAAKVGQLLGVELLVTGSVNEFGQKETSVGAGVGGALRGAVFGGVLNRVGANTKTARVGLDIRLVSVATGELLVAEHFAEEETKTGLDVDTTEFDFDTSARFDDTLAGKATRRAVDRVVQLVSTAVAKVPWSGKIIKVLSDKSVMIKPGSAGGVRVGDRFVVYSQGEDVVDPETGQSLGSQESRAGALEVVEVKENYSTCKVTEGGGFKELDVVREK